MSGLLQNWLNVVEKNKSVYITALKEAIWHMHGSRAFHLKTEHVHETFEGKTVWDGDVEIFSLTNHPKALHAFAWAHLDGAKDEKTRFVAVLEIPPVIDAKTAVQASIMADLKK